MPGGRVTFIPEVGSSLTLLVEGPPERGGGVGGWESSERGGTRPAKWFKSIPDDTYSWPLILDIDEVGGPPIERRLRVLRDMGQPQGHDNEPPAITVTGDLWEHDGNIQWVMNELTLGERLWNSDGSLRRQHVTVGLERYTPLDEIEAVRIRPTRTGTKKKRRSVVVHGNDTLRVIAVRELGDATRWKDLRRWNAKLKRTDPDARLRTGLHITLR